MGLLQILAGIVATLFGLVIAAYAYIFVSFKSAVNARLKKQEERPCPYLDRLRIVEAAATRADNQYSDLKEILGKIQVTLDLIVDGKINIKTRNQ
jgi:hypothetical protein